MSPEWWVSMKDLDPDQLAVMRIPIGGRHLVLGPPGSGKTNLLLLRASYLARSGLPNILVVVFGRTLKEFLLRGAAQYGFDSVKVTTSVSWFYDVLRQCGANSLSGGLSFEQLRTQLVERVRAAVDARGAPLYDAVLLDEAQDFSSEELALFFSMGRQVFAVGDGFQKIYAGDEGLSVLKTNCEVHTLRHHYRNGLKICRLADEIASSFPGRQPLLQTSQYPESILASSVDSDCLLNFDGQMRLIRERISRQLVAYPRELIGVLCPRRTDVDRVAESLLASQFGQSVIKQSFAEGYSPFDDAGGVCVCTIHGSKGLEFRAVHLACLESLRSFPLQRQLAYTGVTRAKTSLSLYSSDRFPGYLESALLSLVPPPKLPPLDAAFGEDYR